MKIQHQYQLLHYLQNDWHNWHASKPNWRQKIIKTLSAVVWKCGMLTALSQMDRLTREENSKYVVLPTRKHKYPKLQLLVLPSSWRHVEIWALDERSQAQTDKQLYKRTPQFFTFSLTYNQCLDFTSSPTMTNTIILGNLSCFFCVSQNEKTCSTKAGMI